jgi:hypothetical protein
LRKVRREAALLVGGGSGGEAAEASPAEGRELALNVRVINSYD